MSPAFSTPTRMRSQAGYERYSASAVSRKQVQAVEQVQFCLRWSMPTLSPDTPYAGPLIDMLQQPSLSEDDPCASRRFPIHYLANYVRYL